MMCSPHLADGWRVGWRVGVGLRINQQGCGGVSLKGNLGKEAGLV